MRKVALTNQEFDELRNKAIESEPRVFRTHLSKIAVVTNTFTDNIVVINDKPVSVNANFVNKLLTQLNINKKMLKTFDDSQEMTAELINLINAQKHKSGDKEVCVVVSSDNEVVDLTDTNDARISNKNFFDIIEAVADKYQLDVIDSSINNQSGIVAVNLVKPSVVEMLNLSNEKHQFGIKMTNSLSTTSVADFMYRLGCTNGMTAVDTMSQSSLLNTSPSEVQKMFQHVQRMADNGFIPSSFNDLIAMSMNTTASLNEVENVINAITNRMNLPLDVEKDEREVFITQFINTHFPEYAIRREELRTKGYDIQQMEKKDKAFIRCESDNCGRITIWDLVNKLTYFGSNAKGDNFKETEGLQIAGGNLLSQKMGYDLQNDKIKLLKL